MKFLFFFAFFFFFATVCWAHQSSLVDQIASAETSDFKYNLVRHKRATCPWFPSACEVHCRSKGFSTGFCRGGTCTCKNH